METKIYLHGLNIVLKTQTSITYIPTRSGRINPRHDYVQVTDEETNKSTNIKFGDIQKEDGSGFGSLDEAMDYLTEFIGGFKQGGAVGESGAYKPTVEIDTFLPSVVEISKTSDVVVKGSFIDYINEVIMTAPNEVGASVSVVSKSFNEMVLQLTTNSDLQTYTLTFKTADGQEYTIDVEAKNISIYTPSPTGTGQSLWVKNGASNSAVLTLGGYEAENNNGNGWNEHGTFGSFTSSSRMEFGFTVDRLQGASGAYCNIATSTISTANPGGNPRVCIQNGSQFYVYAPNGIQIATTSISVNDAVNIVLEANKYEVFINGISIAVYNGTVNMTNIFMNFTGYRVAKLSNINAKILKDDT